MRVTRESLIRIAKEKTQERAYNDHTIVAAYLTGSLLSGEDPMLGGTTDIDLVLVHLVQAPAARQIVKLTPDFHLDIRHRLRTDFGSPRELRTDPLLAWELYDPMLLYQRQRFFEFIQAGLRAGFEFAAPEFVLARCHALYASARKTWFQLSELKGEGAGPAEVGLYLSAVNEAANTVAELGGGPLPERRLLRDFPARAQAAERPDFTAILFGLLGAAQVNTSVVQSWLEPWRMAFLEASQQGGAIDDGIHAARLNYYEKAMSALLEGDIPLAALWPLLRTWTAAARVLPQPGGASWAEACATLGLLGAAFEGQVSALDGFLDEIEVRLDEIAAANGLETSTSV